MRTDGENWKRRVTNGTKIASSASSKVVRCRRGAFLCFGAATASVVAKTLVLYTIMVTGAIWEKVVFGRYLFAGPFFWEDVVSMGVIALHTAYLISWFFELAPPQMQLWIALAAYFAYVVNAIQFLIKFQSARRSSPSHSEILAGEYR